jgi:spermidine/putrescine transport system substrate-binding protein
MVSRACAVIGAGIAGLLLLLAGCDRPTDAVGLPAAPPGAEIVLYDWAEDMPQTVIDAFQTEFGVTVRYETYESQEEAVASIVRGMPVDVAVIEHDFLAPLLAGILLAAIDRRNIPNFKNILPNFRDLATDPGNRHSVPYHFGTTGLLVRSDLIGHAVSSWSDLWDPRYAGKVAVRPQMRELMAITLLALGYSPNSEDPTALEAMLQRLLELRKQAILVDPERFVAVPVLLRGEAVVLAGWGTTTA